MPYDLVLLPLVGGYWFVSLCHLTRLSFAKESGERLLFGAATAGTILAGLAWFGASFVAGQLPDVHTAWRAVAPPWPFAGTAFAAFLLGPLAAFVVNRFASPGRAEAHAINTSGTGLERLFWSATDPDDPSLVQITLDDGKVYVGWIERTAPNPRAPDSFVRLLPTLSGYRDARRCFEVTTNYEPVYSRLLEDGELDDAEMVIINAFVKVLPLSRIVSAGIYLPEARELFDGAVKAGQANSAP